MARGLKFWMGLYFVAKRKVTMQLICFFVFAYAERRFSLDVAHICNICISIKSMKYEYLNKNVFYNNREYSIWERCTFSEIFFRFFYH